MGKKRYVTRYGRSGSWGQTPGQALAEQQFQLPRDPRRQPASPQAPFPPNMGAPPQRATGSPATSAGWPNYPGKSAADSYFQALTQQPDPLGNLPGYRAGVGAGFSPSEIARRYSLLGTATPLYTGAQPGTFSRGLTPEEMKLAVEGGLISGGRQSSLSGLPGYGAGMAGPTTTPAPQASQPSDNPEGSYFGKPAGRGFWTDPQTGKRYISDKPPLFTEPGKTIGYQSPQSPLTPDQEQRRRDIYYGPVPYAPGDTSEAARARAAQQGQIWGPQAGRAPGSPVSQPGVPNPPSDLFGDPGPYPVGSRQAGQWRDVQWGSEEPLYHRGGNIQNAPGFNPSRSAFNRPLTDEERRFMVPITENLEQLFGGAQAAVAGGQDAYTQRRMFEPGYRQRENAVDRLRMQQTWARERQAAALEGRGVADPRGVVPGLFNEDQRRLAERRRDEYARSGIVQVPGVGERVHPMSVGAGLAPIAERVRAEKAARDARYQALTAIPTADRIARLKQMTPAQRAAGQQFFAETGTWENLPKSTREGITKRRSDRTTKKAEQLATLRAPGGALRNKAERKQAARDAQMNYRDAIASGMSPRAAMFQQLAGQGGNGMVNPWAAGMAFGKEGFDAVMEARPSEKERAEVDLLRQQLEVARSGRLTPEQAAAALAGASELMSPEAREALEDAMLGGLPSPIGTTAAGTTPVSPPTVGRRPLRSSATPEQIDQAITRYVDTLETVDPTTITAETIAQAAAALNVPEAKIWDKISSRRGSSLGRLFDWLIWPQQVPFIGGPADPARQFPGGYGAQKRAQQRAQYDAIYGNRVP